MMGPSLLIKETFQHIDQQKMQITSYSYQFLKRPYSFGRDPKETHFLLEKKVQPIFFFYLLCYFPKIIRLNDKKRLLKIDLIQLFAEKGDFSNKKRP